MAGMALNILSSCARSPYFECTRERTRGLWRASGAPHSGGVRPSGERGILGLAQSGCSFRRARATAGDRWSRRRPLSGSDIYTSAKYARGQSRPLRVACHHGGGIACDGVVFRLAADRFWYVHADRDVFTWMSALSNVRVVERLRGHHPRSPNVGTANPGPRSLKILAECCDEAMPTPLRYFHAAQITLGGQPVLVSRTGWTGELGFEIYNLDPTFDGPALWNHLLTVGIQHGLEPCSTYAMNPRRIEAGILNYGTDMDWDTTPFDLGLGRFVDFEGDFVGRDALTKADKRARLSGFKVLRGDIKWGDESVLRWRARGDSQGIRLLTVPAVRRRVSAFRQRRPSGERAAHRARPTRSRA